MTSLSPARRRRLHLMLDRFLDATLAPGQDANIRFDRSGQFSAEIFPSCSEEVFHVDRIAPPEFAEALGRMAVAARRDGSAGVIRLAFAN